MTDRDVPCGHGQADPCDRTCPECGADLRDPDQLRADRLKAKVQEELEAALRPFTEMEPEDVDRRTVEAVVAQVFRRHLPGVADEDRASVVSMEVDDNGVAHCTLRVPGWAGAAMALLEPDGELSVTVAAGEMGPAVEPTVVRTAAEGAEVFGEPASSRLTTAERDAMVTDLVDYVEARIREEEAAAVAGLEAVDQADVEAVPELDRKATELVAGWLQEGGCQVLHVSDADAMAESIRTHPIMEIPGSAVRTFSPAHRTIHTEAQVIIPLRTTKDESEALAEWMAEVSGPVVDRADWTWPEGATGLRLELATDVEVRDGRLVTPEGGVKGRFVDPDGVPPGSMELVCPSRTWLLQGVYPKGRSWPEDLADVAVGLQPLRWEVTGRARPSVDRPDLQETDLPHTEAIGPGHGLEDQGCRECGDPGEVAHYYLTDDGPGVTAYCGPCATELDGVAWPPEEVDDGQE